MTSANSRLKSDPEFKKLSFPMSDEIYQELERAIIDKEVYPEITVWNNSLILGFNTYEICRRLKIKPFVRRMEFEGRRNAIAWCCQQRLSQPEVSDPAFKYYIGKLYLVTKGDATIDLGSELGVPAPLEGRRNHYKAEIIGTKYGMGHACVSNYSIFADKLDVLMSKHNDLAHRVRTGTIKISTNCLADVSSLSTDYLNTFYEHLSPKKVTLNRRTIETLIQKCLATPVIESTKPSISRDKVFIKQIPAYDPDAEASSLALTIPSWIGSMQRVHKISDITFVSTNAATKLLYQLENMKDTIELMLRTIKEELDGRDL